MQGDPQNLNSCSALCYQLHASLLSAGCCMLLGLSHSGRGLCELRAVLISANHSLCSEKLLLLYVLAGQPVVEKAGASLFLGRWTFQTSTPQIRQRRREHRQQWFAITAAPRRSRPRRKISALWSYELQPSSLTPCFCLSFCLQAVETNLASKDSHWVFVNEVRCDALRQNMWHYTLSNT